MPRDIRPEDSLEVAQRALQKVNELEGEVEEARDERDEVFDRLTSLELRYEDLDGDRDYADLSDDAKVGRIREHAFERAVDGTGHARLDYNAVKWEVFDGEPVARTCYNLMRKAASVDGFEFKEPSGSNNHLAVNAAEVRKARDRLFARNKRGGEGVEQA